MAVTHHGTLAACHQAPPHAPPLFLWSPPGERCLRWRCLCPWPERELWAQREGWNKGRAEEEQRQEEKYRSRWTSTVRQFLVFIKLQTATINNKKHLIVIENNFPLNLSFNTSDPLILMCNNINILSVGTFSLNINEKDSDISIFRPFTFVPQLNKTLEILVKPLFYIL